MRGIKEKQHISFWQVVFERAVFNDGCELLYGVGLGWGRLALFERKVIVLEPVSHPREGKLDTKKTLGYQDDSLCADHVTGNQAGT